MNEIVPEIKTEEIARTVARALCTAYGETDGSIDCRDCAKADGCSHAANARLLAAGKAPDVFIDR